MPRSERGLRSQSGLGKPSQLHATRGRLARRLTSGQTGAPLRQPGRLKSWTNPVVPGPQCHCFFFRVLAPLSGRLAARASPLRGHHQDARSGRRRRADKADTSSEDGRHRWRSRATPLGVVAASTWLPHTVRRPDLALKSHRPCEAHEGSSGHVTMRDRRAYYLSRPLTA